MSKSPKNTTTILCNDKDLSTAADKILDLAKEKSLTKSGLLNVVTASLFGPGKDWGFVRGANRPLLSQRTNREYATIFEALTAESAKPENNADPAKERDSVVPEADPFTQHCIEIAYDTFYDVALCEDEIQTALKDGILTQEDIDKACRQATIDFISETYGNPVEKEDRREIEAEGIYEMIYEVIIADDYSRLFHILDIDQRREDAENAEPTANEEAKTGANESQDHLDPFTAECLELAEEAFEAATRDDIDIHEAESLDLLQEGEFGAAIKRAAREFLQETYGFPIDLLTSYHVKGIGLHAAIGDKIWENEMFRVAQIIRARERVQAHELAQEASRGKIPLLEWAVELDTCEPILEHLPDPRMDSEAVEAACKIANDRQETIMIMSARINPDDVTDRRRIFIEVEPEDDPTKIRAALIQKINKTKP